MRAVWVSMCIAAVFLCHSDPCYGDIFVRHDESGALVFTNCPTGTDWQMYAREKPKYGYSSRSKSAYETIVASIAAREGMDPSLIQSIIEVESGFNSRAFSPKGAMGLMQLMPETARELGVCDPWDPVENITGGTRYLSRLLKRYRGDLTKALAAYNAGPTVVDAYGGIPPYQETQEYVNNVLAIFNGGGNAAE